MSESLNNYIEKWVRDFLKPVLNVRCDKCGQVFADDGKTKCPTCHPASDRLPATGESK